MELERRKVSIVERWYIARSKAGSTPRVHVGFSLSLDDPLSHDEIKARLGSVLLRLTQIHPFLNSRVVGHDTPDPELKLVDDRGLNPDDIITTVAGGELDRALSEEISRDFDLDGRLWTVFLLLPDEAKRSKNLFVEVYIGLSIHHVIVDGMSVLAVARTLVLLLNNPTLDLGVSAPPSLPVSLESRLSVRPSAANLTSTLFNAFVHPQLPKIITSLYASQTACYCGSANPPPHPRRQRHRLVQIAPDKLRRIVAISRENKATLTVVLNTLVILAFSPLVPSNYHLESTTPVSLRPLISQTNPVSAGGVYVGPITYSSPSHSFPTNLADFFALCRPFAAKLRSSSELQDGIQKWGIVNFLSFPSLISYLRGQVTTGGDKKTFGLSNLGNTTFTGEEVRGGWKPVKGVFTQPLHGLGAAFNVDVLSVVVEGNEDRGDGCTIAFGWEEGVLSEQEVDAVIRRTREGWDWLVKATGA